ncbi:class I SAM-dependent methyltransferase [Nonomuraea gerenzanensis]|uniref:Methyltransferase type 11 n=1 Tax=Nonomuraea gerenzanensis TaxID=93944 RepID=A0A1M4E180_9ACTN|nr:class I SAM-dependent methyltransferase [Nonomuraea gerenzanensis]SBO92545.1 Methyltransferase type 11 [Nonomuraea gerenzanensis]
MPSYSHPLAWLLGLEGAALLRAQAGDLGDAAYVERRIAEIRALVTDPGPALNAGTTLGHATTEEGYAQWAAHYDSDGNPLIAAEEPLVQGILAALPPGRALDAACGTGRHAAFLAGLGHEVVGVDTSAQMLAKARPKVPGGEFHQADLHDLPAAPGSFDVVVCALALTHQPTLGPALAELARVVRPGGHVVLSDVHPLSLYLGGVPTVAGRDGVRTMTAGRFLASDYITAIHEAGLRILSCHEPRWGRTPGGHGGPLAQERCPEAAAAAYEDTPALIIWHLQRPTWTLRP